MIHFRGRVLLNIIAIAAIVLAYLLLSALAQTLGNLSQEADVSRNMVVIDGDVLDPSDATLDPDAVQAATDLSPDLIGRVSPMIFRHLRINERFVQLRAANLADWSTIHHLSLERGQWPDQPGKIAISNGAAAIGDWDLGSSVKIFGSQFEVMGIVRFEGTEYASIWMDLPLAEALFGPDRGYQLMLVEIARRADADTARASLQADPRVSDRYEVFFEDNYTRRNTSFLKDIQGTANAVVTVALLGVMLGTYNATNLSLIERERQIGILRVVGFRPWAVRFLLLIQAIIQGLFGFSVGLLAALIVLARQQYADQLYAFGWPLTLTLTPKMILLGMSLTVGLAALGSLLATRRMLTPRPAEVLHL